VYQFRSLLLVKHGIWTLKWRKEYHFHVSHKRRISQTYKLPNPSTFFHPRKKTVHLPLD